MYVLSIQALKVYHSYVRRYSYTRSEFSLFDIELRYLNQRGISINVRFIKEIGLGMFCPVTITCRGYLLNVIATSTKYFSFLCLMSI